MRKKKPAKKKKPERDSYHLPVRSEAEQFEGLSEDLKDAWKSLKRFLLGLGPQEPMRTSHRSIMFYRKTCYIFIRPKKSFLELNVFLPNQLDSEFVKKSESVSKTKFVNIIPITHPDQIESPITDWIREAFEFSQ
jgi:hypothetical protein